MSLILRVLDILLYPPSSERELNTPVRLQQTTRIQSNRTHSTRRDIVLPLGTPIRGRDGKLMDNIFVPNNTMVMVGVIASNRNPALWGPDCDEWKPERWLSPLPDALKDTRLPGIYSNLYVDLPLDNALVTETEGHRMTFSGGGKACM